MSSFATQQIARGKSLDGLAGNDCYTIPNAKPTGQQIYPAELRVRLDHMRRWKTEYVPIAVTVDTQVYVYLPIQEDSLGSASW